MILLPKSAGEFIAQKSRHVKISNEGIERLGTELIKAIQEGDLSKSTFCDTPHHPKPENDWAVDWIFLIDTLNFCFWSESDSIDNEKIWKVDGEEGYFGLCAAINKARKNNIDIINPYYYSKMSIEELNQIFQSDDKKTEIPLLQERLKCLHEVGSILIDKFQGTFKTCLYLAKGSAVELLKIIVENFPCFQDEALYLDQRVAFYKRAQILVADLWSCFNSNKNNFNVKKITNGISKEHVNCNGDDIEKIIALTSFNDIKEITMFADYRVPQCLKYYNVLQYSDELLNVLNRKELLINGCIYEVEIRGCSIHAIELLKQWLINKHATYTNINSVLIDQYLWEHRRKLKSVMDVIPFHKVVSIYY